MTYDPTKDITIDYNHLNLPLKVDYGDDRTIEWTYDAEGNKLRKEVKNGNTSLEDRYYIGAAEYNDSVLVQVMHDYGRVARQNPCLENQFVSGLLDDTKTYQGKNVLSDAYSVPPGTTEFKGVESITLNEDFKVDSGKVFQAEIVPCDPGQWEYQYRIADHLNNTRIIFADQNNNGSITSDEIIQEMHYSSYGRPLTGEWNDRERNDYRYQYNNHEVTEDFNLNWRSGH